MRGDAVEMIPRLGMGAVDLFFTSPPYADQRAYSRIHPDRYVEWFLPFAEAMYEATSETGSLVLNIKNRVANRGALNGQRHPYVYRLVLALQDRSRLFPGVNDSRRRFFSITTKISRRDPRPGPHEYHPPIVYTPRSTRCSPPVTTWRPPWSRWRGSVPSCCCRPRWRRRSPASSAGTATPA